MKDMKIQKYKPGKLVFPFNSKINYYQTYWCSKLEYKGYRNHHKFIGYVECYLDRMNKGIKYKI